jgi:MFS family permease
LGYTLTGIFISFFAFAYNTLQVLFYRTVGWIGRGIREPPRDALLTDSVEPENYGHAFGFHRMMDTLGAIMGPSIAFILLPIIGFRNVFLVALLPGILAILVFALFTREKVCKQKVDRKAKAVGRYKRVARRIQTLLVGCRYIWCWKFRQHFPRVESPQKL